MIRLLLILVLAQSAFVSKVWRVGGDDPGVVWATDVDAAGFVGAPAIVCHRPRSVCLGESCWVGCCNASQAARFALNIHGMDELPDLDGEIQEEP